MKPLAVIVLLDPSRDGVQPATSRWNSWRPSFELAAHEDLSVNRLVLLHRDAHQQLADNVARDLAVTSPATRVEPYVIDFTDSSNFEEVYSRLLDFARSSQIDATAESYLIQMASGMNLVQICLVLLTQAGFLPGRLVEPPLPIGTAEPVARRTAIDLDLSRYESISTRLVSTATERTSYLKTFIKTRNSSYNAIIDGIERIANRSKPPLLLLGPAGVGKSRLARRFYDLKRMKNRLKGAFVEANCATLKGDSAMSTLVGHRAGAFPGAAVTRAGLLRSADKGVLFLSEIESLGAAEQAMLLRMIDKGSFLSIGADRESLSNLQLIVASRCDLVQEVAEGRFRNDLYIRLSPLTFRLPGLSDRREDIAPNVDYELDRFAKREGYRVTLTSSARDRYLAFAESTEALWTGNFRDLAVSVARMAMFSSEGRINESRVAVEVARLQRLWSIRTEPRDGLESVLAPEHLAALDTFDRVQLVHVIDICRRSRTLSDAGRTLFAASLADRVSPNAAHRLSKYLQRHGLKWRELRDTLPTAGFSPG